MTIRLKIIFVVLPLIIVSLVFAQGVTWLGVTRGINRMAEESLDFKLYELENYAENQWTLLVENGYAERDDMVRAAKSAVETYAETLAIKPTEKIFALDRSGAVVMQTGDNLEVPEDEIRELLAYSENNKGAMLHAFIAEKDRVLKMGDFIPFRWRFFVSDERDAFFRTADRITTQALITLASASIAAIVLLVMFSRFLTKPLVKINTTMQGIIKSNDLSARTEVFYDDEIGSLAQTFNFMLDELEKSYKQTKKYAFESTLAKKKETRIREIFQKYVPQDVINQFFASPESMLKGDNRELAVLFSDIRSFTTISENMPPEEIVSCLNRYFSGQVDAVMRYDGIVDKYIGDALMAFWGAPVKTENDALSAVMAAFDMLDALKSFNEEQKILNKPVFNIGIGINFGQATVGNIGNDHKMNYTIIGDAVNLASRVEELTKEYKEQLLITESVYEKVEAHVYARTIDSVTVRGKTEEVKIFAISRR
ncbi:MAG: HAMP domain-containing protein [Spirochaetaceae bacterium]|jgi:class 3 adenylate cyclase/HAMP domain-containing protein|nr:HAMP domain-containing protein [Spirochaetaceae bacterium]